MAKSHINQSFSSWNETEKKHEYEERVCNVKHGTFSPLVFSAAGGMGPIATTFYRCLVSFCLTNHISPTIRRFAGFVATWVSPCLDHWLCV